VRLQSIVDGRLLVVVSCCSATVHVVGYCLVQQEMRRGAELWRVIELFVNCR
jgi:hypothetical protein